MAYIWVKEMKATVKDEGVLIFFILVPLVYPLLYGWIYKNQFAREVPVAIVDLSGSRSARTFIRMYDASPDVSVASRVESMAAARHLMGLQEVEGILVIPSDFEKRLFRNEQAKVALYCDMSIMLHYKALYQTAMLVATQMNEHIQVAHASAFTARDEELAIAPMRVADVPMFSPTGGYADFILPGVLMLIIHQTLLLGIGLSAGTARENNRYRQLIPMSRHFMGLFRVVLGKSLCYFMVYCVMSAYLVWAVPRIFGTIEVAQPWVTVAFLLPYLLSTIFFGMTLSCVVRYRENIILLIVFTTVPLLFLSGISWPQSNIPSALQGISWLFPSTFGVRGFVRINSMGADLSAVRTEYVALWIQTVVYFLLTCLVYRFQIITAVRQSNRSMANIRQKNLEISHKEK